MGESGEPLVAFAGSNSQPPSPKPANPGPELPTLLERMRAGDRTAAADFTARYGDLIRRRVRGKLGPAMRRVFDSMDMLSTIGRRLDLFVRSGRMHAVNDAQLWKLVFEISEVAVLDKVRAFKRLEQAEREDSPVAQLLLSRMHRAEGRSQDGPAEEIERVLALLRSDADRQLLLLWLKDMPLFRIAELLDSTPAAVRKRWQSIRIYLRTELETVP